MLADLVFTIIATITLFFLNLLPSGSSSFSMEIVNGWHFIATEAAKWNSLLPINSMFNAMYIYIVAWGFLITWYIFKWLIELVRSKA